MQEQRRHADLPQPAVIQILIVPPHRVRNPKPSRAISLQHRRPLRLPVVLRQQLLRLLTQIFRVCGKSLEERARPRLPPQQMKSLQNQALAALRRRQPNHRANHRSVAVPPKNSSLDPQPVKECNRFRRRPPVKIEQHLPGGSRRMPISRPVRNQHPELVLELFNLPIKRVNPIPPTAMQKNQRPPLPKFSIMDRDRAKVWCMHRMNQLEGRHLVPPFKESLRRKRNPEAVAIGLARCTLRQANLPTQGVRDRTASICCSARPKGCRAQPVKQPKK